MKKKLLAISLVSVMALSMAACGAKQDTADTSSKSEAAEENSSSFVEEASKEAEASEESEAELGSDADEDMDYVMGKGVLTVGITDFEPMDYQDADGEWIGFDADMARAFAEYLGVDVEFVEIDWDNKILELDGKQIDCVWNGMTLTDEVMSAMECSDAYCNNAQIVIVKADVADQYQDIESLKELTFAVEAGSAGAAEAQANEFNYVEVQNQAAALMEVAAGTSDAAIIDSLMAAAMVGEGTSYENLTYTVPLNSEEYGVGFRKDSRLALVLNEFFAESYDNGTMQEIAEKYGVQAALIEQK